MALLGKAAVAMWWDITPEQREEFEDWHSHEHFPERMGIDGFLRGSRWASADGGEGFFVMYELAHYETLTSAGYLARLNNPTPWSAKLMQHHRNMVRSQCRVLDSAGGGLAGFSLTLRLAPAAGRGDALHAHLAALSRTLAQRPGTVAGHLLRTETPPMAVTTEQAIRGGPDRAADWIYLATGYDQAALRGLRAGELADEVLSAHGAQPGIAAGVYALRCAAGPADFKPFG